MSIQRYYSTLPPSTEEWAEKSRDLQFLCESLDRRYQPLFPQFRGRDRRKHGGEDVGKDLTEGENAFSMRLIHLFPRGAFIMVPSFYSEGLLEVFSRSCGKICLRQGRVCFHGIELPALNLWDGLRRRDATPWNFVRETQRRNAS